MLKNRANQVNLTVSDRSVTNVKQLTLGIIAVIALVLVSDFTFKIYFQLNLIVG